MVFGSRSAICQIFRGKKHGLRAATVIAIKEARAETKLNYGYLALVSDDIKKAVQALETYRNKDLEEKAFENLKK